MNKIQENIQLIINTIQSVDIKADYDTMNKLLGCLQMLATLKTDAANWVVADTGSNSVTSDNIETEENNKEESQ